MSIKIRGADGRLYTLSTAIVATLGIPAVAAATPTEAATPVEHIQQAPETAASDLLAGTFEYIPV